MSQNKKPEYWDTKQMAAYYGNKVTTRTIRNWIAKGAFNGQMGPRIGRKHLLLPPSTATGTTTNAA